jgi:hypothetical protein
MPGVTTAYQTGVHGSRPAATAGCILYSCTTHGLVYRSDGSAWSTWLTLPSGVSSASPALTLTTSAAAGAASTYVATDASIPIFDTTAPVTQAFSDSAAVGTAAFAARRDHKHGMPAASTGALTQIAQTVLGSAATNITFSSIAGTYSSLMIIFTGRTDRVNTIDYLDMQFNTDTAGNYNFTAWDSVPTTAGGTTGQTALRASPIAGANAVANKPGSAKILIPDYARTVFHKTVLSEGYKPDSQIATKNAGDWNSTAAITAIKLIPAVGPNFITGTVATLYGIS